MADGMSIESGKPIKVGNFNNDFCFCWDEHFYSIIRTLRYPLVSTEAAVEISTSESIETRLHVAGKIRGLAEIGISSSTYSGILDC